MEQDRRVDSLKGLGDRLNEWESCTAPRVSTEAEGIAADSRTALSRLSSMCSNKHFTPCHYS